MNPLVILVIGAVLVVVAFVSYQFGGQSGVRRVVSELATLERSVRAKTQARGDDAVSGVIELPGYQAALRHVCGVFKLTSY